MKWFLRIVLPFILLNLFLLGISFYIPGRVGFIDRCSILMEKTLVNQLDKLGSLSEPRHIKDDPYTADAFSYVELRPYLEEMKPGTLFFSDQGRAVSSFFISGIWKHCGIYIGSKSQVEQYWGTDHEVVQILSTYYASGNEYLIFDSSYEQGVAIRDIKEMAELSHLSTLRRLLLFEYKQSKESLSQLLKSGLEYLGKSYDYCFVLEDKDALYCSELLYHVCSLDQDNIRPSKKILGRDFLLPSDLVRYIADEELNTGKYRCIGNISRSKGRLILSSLQ